MLFLVDSGAERTVIRECDDFEPSPETVNVMSANGKITKSPVSKPLKITLSATGDTPVPLKVILSKLCPHNLLGRDLITKLDLIIETGDKGSLVARPRGTEAYVLEGEGSLHYWWSLDLPSRDPTRTVEQLVKLTRDRVTGQADYMGKDDLHMTLRYKRTPGPDPPYQAEVEKLGPQTMMLPYMYYRRERSFCDVQVSDAAKRLMSDSDKRHVSLSKKNTDEWKDLGPLREQVMRLKDWTRTEPMVEESLSSGWSRVKLNFRITGTPATHLADE